MIADEVPEPVEKRVDERWKEEIERERRRLRAHGGAPPEAPASGQPPRPRAAGARPSATELEEPALAEPNFAVFLSSLSMQAMMALGELPVPGTDQRHEDLDQARYLIDTLGLLQEKTRGNLTAEESQVLENALYELRLRYAQKLQPPMPPPPSGGRR